VDPNSRLPFSCDSAGTLLPTSGRCANPFCEIKLSDGRMLDMDARGGEVTCPGAGLATERQRSVIVKRAETVIKDKRAP